MREIVTLIGDIRRKMEEPEGPFDHSLLEAIDALDETTESIKALVSLEPDVRTDQC